MSALRTSGLVKRFGTTCAVDDVELVVHDGEIRGLLGPNGAGKTTLLRLLFGLVAPDAGTIELLGREHEGSAASELDGVAGFVEEPTFYPYLSARTNLELLWRLDRSTTQPRIDEVLERVGLSTRGDDRVGEYSTGMRQRLGIAAAFLREPRLLLLDEPMGGLDPGGLRGVSALLEELAREGTAVLLSSHQIGEIEQICDSFTFLRSGAVVWSGSASELRAQAPSSAYLLESSDDRRALVLAESHAGVSARPREHGLAIELREGSLDAFVLALARDGVAVRRLELIMTPLEAMFFALTGE